MKLFKWALIFIFCLLLAIILIQNFTLEAFKQSVSAHILFYTTPQIPVYSYMIGSFISGLFIGLFVALYNFISSTKNNRKKSKEIKKLEKERDALIIKKDENLNQEKHTTNNTSISEM